MRNARFLSLVVVLLIGSGVFWQLQGAEYGPLPAKVEHATTVYLYDLGQDSAVFDNLYTRLKKWGRWKVVAELKDADLILAFAQDDSFTAIPLPSTTTTTSQAGAASGPAGSVAVAGTSTSTRGGGSMLVGSMKRFLAIIDPQGGQRYITISCERRMSAAYTAGVLVNRLKKRIDNAAK